MSTESEARPMRYFIDDWEVTEADVREAELAGTAYVVRGGSGVVPKGLRRPGESEDEYLRPWLAMHSTNPVPPTAGPTTPTPAVPSRRAEVNGAGDE